MKDQKHSIPNSNNNKKKHTIRKTIHPPKKKAWFEHDTPTKNQSGMPNTKKRKLHKISTNTKTKTNASKQHKKLINYQKSMKTFQNKKSNNTYLLTTRQYTLFKDSHNKQPIENPQQSTKHNLKEPLPFKKSRTPTKHYTIREHTHNIRQPYRHTFI